MLDDMWLRSVMRAPNSGPRIRKPPIGGSGGRVTAPLPPACGLRKRAKHPSSSGLWDCGKPAATRQRRAVFQAAVGNRPATRQGRAVFQGGCGRAAGRAPRPAEGRRAFRGPSTTAVRRVLSHAAIELFFSSSRLLVFWAGMRGGDCFPRA